MSNKVRNIFFLFGLVAVALMFVTFNISLSEVWGHICKAHWWIAVVLSMWFILYMMNALTWKVILAGQGRCRIPFHRLLKLTISGFALNYATPAGLMGGEPYKILELIPYVGRERATSSVLLFSMMHIFSHFCYWFIVALISLLCIEVGVAMKCALLFAAVFSVCGIYLFLKGYKNGFVVNVLGLISRIPGLKKWMSRFMDTHFREIVRIDNQIAALHNQNRRCFFYAFGLEFVGRILQAFEIFFILYALGIAGDVVQLLLYSTFIISLTSLLANLLFVMPMQLGGREGGFVLTAVQLGLTSDLGMFVSVICRIRELFWTIIGMLMIKIGNHSGIKRRIAIS